MRADTYEWKSDFTLKHIAEAKAKAEGRVEGGIEVLLIVLEAKGFTIEGDLRRRITACQEFRQFRIRVRRAATARTLDDIFA
ncbi:hypothetical protein LUW76_35595 [Actinomadura madurae]|uniref:hypothetical protein n=1 Tax=Actinomadura madurae TaxID=1993 RepID=UPI0020264568|nr:hypothetical protein [Actinomadura madurae]URM99224.1 hypothetical protein LUW76_35595 [Actinomadura madurae]URN09911.1 hypothetical protein LUW74_45560 [Actinomadura madurae]